MTFWKTSVSTFAIAAVTALPLAAQSTDAEAETETQSIMETEQGTAADTAADALENTAEDVAEGAEQAADTVAEGAEQAAEGAADAAKDMAEGAEQAAENAADMAQGEPTGEVEGTIVMQDRDTVLASDLMGASVYNTEREAIGDINDMIVSIDGDVDGVVIGVGGFLGIGEKDVAVDMAAFDLQETEYGAPRLVLDTTAEELKAADAFVTASEQRQMEQVEQNRATDYNGNTQTTTAGSDATN